MPILDKNDFKVESKGHYILRKAIEKGQQVVQYVEDHKETIAIMTPIVIGAIGVGRGLTRGITRHRHLMAERELKDLRVYDRRLGAYLKLRKPLKNSDWKKITPRVNKGERLVDVLQSMDMLK